MSTTENKELEEDKGNDADNTSADRLPLIAPSGDSRRGSTVSATIDHQQSEDLSKSHDFKVVSCTFGDADSGTHQEHSHSTASLSLNGGGGGIELASPMRVTDYSMRFVSAGPLMEGSMPFGSVQQQAIMSAATLGQESEENKSQSLSFKLHEVPGSNGQQQRKSSTSEEDQSIDPQMKKELLDNSCSAQDLQQQQYHSCSDDCSVQSNAIANQQQPEEQKIQSIQSQRQTNGDSHSSSSVSSTSSSQEANKKNDSEDSENSSSGSHQSAQVKQNIDQSSQSLEHNLQSNPGPAIQASSPTVAHMLHPQQDVSNQVVEFPSVAQPDVQASGVSFSATPIVHQDDTSIQEKQQTANAADEETKTSQHNAAEEEDEEEEEEEEEEYDEDDRENMSASSYVVEISPKGRFKRFGEELGRGAYKIVYKGVDNETGREIAWNVINLNRLPKQDRVRIKSEIDLIKKLEHKNIIHFISAWYNKEREQVVFITEMITGGSLRKYVKRIKAPYLKVIKGWCREILQGLVYLHQQKPHPIIHRDLKCDNIFINSNSGEIRIGDLGLSTPMQNSFTTSVLGTPEFMAPELYEECYGTSVDIYAFGMCVLEMITLERPYKECQNPAQIYHKVVHGIRPQAFERIKDPEVRDFILQCLNKAEMRPSAQQLLDSKFVNDLDSEKNNHEVQVTKGPAKEKKKGLMFDNGIGMKPLKKKIASTILEEEEENEGGSRTLDNQQQSEQQQPQVGATGTFGGAEIQVPLEVDQQQPKEEPSQSEPTIETQMTSQPQESQITNNIDQQSHIHPTPIDQQLVDNQPTESQPLNSTQLQSTQILSSDGIEAPIIPQSDQQIVSQKEQKKLKKKEYRNKLLNESVVFLKKIDEEKQKKLQERTLLMTSSQKIEPDDEDDTNPDRLESGGDDDNIDAGAETPIDSHQDQNTGDSQEDENDDQDRDSQDDDEQVLISENMLDELKKEDLLEEERQLALLALHPSGGVSFSANPLGSKPNGAQVLDSDVNQMSNAKREIVQVISSQAAQPRDQEGVVQQKFELKKKFKEDDTTSTSSTSFPYKRQNTKSQKPHEQNSAGQSGTLFRKLPEAPKAEEAQLPFKRSNSNMGGGSKNSDLASSQPHRINQVQILPIHVPSEQNIFQQQHSQQNQLVPLQKKAQFGGSAQNLLALELNQRHPLQQQESVFDNQSSSEDDKDNDGSDHLMRDSEVDKIQLLQQPYQRISGGGGGGQGMVQGQYNNQTYQHNYQAQDYGSYHSQQQSHAGQQQQYDQGRISQGQNDQKRSFTNQNSQKQLTSQQQNAVTKPPPIQPTHVQPSSQSKSQIPSPQLSQPKPTAVLDQMKQLGSINQQKQIQKQAAATNKNDTTNAQAKTSAPTSQNVVQGKPQKDQVGAKDQKMSKVSINFKIDGNNVIFDFDTMKDTPEGVAREMVRDLQLNQSQIEVISKHIQSAINKQKASQAAPQQVSQQTSQQAVRQQPATIIDQPKQAPPSQQKAGQSTSTNPLAPSTSAGGPTSGQQQAHNAVPAGNKKSQAQQQQQQVSPQKLSNQVITSFQKLFTDIEQFYIQLQAIGIDNTEQIVEAMECSQEEKNIRMEFLNKVLLAKREYKQQMEQHKQKQHKIQQKINQQHLHQAHSQQHILTAPSEVVVGYSSFNPSADQQHSSNSASQVGFPQRTSNKLAGSPPTTGSSEKQTQEYQHHHHHNALKKPSTSDVMLTCTGHSGGIGAISGVTYEKSKFGTLERGHAGQNITQSLQKRMYQVPLYIREHFKNSPQQIFCLIKPTKTLKREEQPFTNDFIPEDEVVQLQLLLNLIWNDSIIFQSKKAPTQTEKNQIIDKHIALRVDGYFGEKTERAVIKFQKYLNQVQTGQVSDHLWSLILNQVDQIIQDANKKKEALPMSSTSSSNYQVQQSNKDSNKQITPVSQTPQSVSGSNAVTAAQKQQMQQQSQPSTPLANIGVSQSMPSAPSTGINAMNTLVGVNQPQQQQQQRTSSQQNIYSQGKGPGGNEHQSQQQQLSQQQQQSQQQMHHHQSQQQQQQQMMIPSPPISNSSSNQSTNIGHTNNNLYLNLQQQTSMTPYTQNSGLQSPSKLHRSNGNPNLAADIDYKSMIEKVFVTAQDQYSTSQFEIGGAGGLHQQQQQQYYQYVDNEYNTNSNSSGVGGGGGTQQTNYRGINNNSNQQQYQTSTTQQQTTHYPPPPHHLQQQQPSYDQML